MTTDLFQYQWIGATFKPPKPTIDVLSDSPAVVFYTDAGVPDMPVAKWAHLDQSDFLNQTVVPQQYFDEQSRHFEEQFKAAFGYTKKVFDLCQRLETIEAALVEVAQKLPHSVQQQRSLWVPIESFAPEPYEVRRPLTAVLTAVEDGFEAGLFDANLFASGDTESEALASLKSVLLETYEALQELGESKLGPGPLQQKKTLDTMIRKTDS